MTDRFLGTWEMLPEHNEYEWGDPPQSGLYVIAQSESGYQIIMKWRTTDGQDMEMTYHSIPDGQSYPTDPATGVDSMSMTRVNDRQLDSDARIGDVVVAHAVRILSEDGNQMIVKQSGKTLEEQHEFTNTSIYVRCVD